MKKACRQIAALMALIFAVYATSDTVFALTTQEKLNQAKQEKAQTEAELKQTKDNITGMQGAKDSLQGQLVILNDNLEEVSRNLSNLEEQIGQKEQEIEDTQAALEEAEETVEWQYECMKKRMQFMYERSDTAYLEMLFAANGFGDFLNKSLYMEQLAEYDKKMLKQYQDTQAEIEEEKEKLLAQKQELDELASHDGIRVVYVLSDEEKTGYEHGFISAELIRKYADETDFSLFACGPAAMYDFLKKQAEALKLPRRLVRFEVSGGARNIAADPGFPKEKLGESYELKILVHGEMIVTKCRTEETVLTAIERAGVHAPSECRSGECGFCRSRLISGEVYIPADTDKRRMADARYGWIHPCSSYPVSDLEIEVYPVDAV